MTETQQTISKWATDTFGSAGSNFSVAARANQEMAELLKGLATDDNDPKAPEEAADVIIVLMRIFDRYGLDWQTVVNNKMELNRSRTWNLDGNGHGYHVK